jgi:serralysin
MVPQLSATYSAAQLGIAQISDGVAIIVDNGSADLILCEQSANRATSIDLGTVEDPGTGYFVTESPPLAEEWSMVQASDGMALQTDGAEKRLFLFGASGALTISVIGSDGLPGTAQTVSTSIGALNDVHSFTVIPDASGDLAAVSQGGVSGLHLFHIGGNASLTLTETVLDTPKSYVDEVTDSASVLLNGQAYLLTLSAAENGITSYAVNDQGQAELVDSLGNRDGLAISGAQAIQTASVGGQTFAIIASVTSDSLSVVRVNDMGCLFQTDHVVDDLDARIRGASALDVFEVNGRVFVIAGGSDAGLTTYELLPGGRLSLMSEAAFETGQGMGNIASIDTAVNGDQVSIYVTEESGTRLQIFVSDFSDLGSLLVAAGNQTSGGGLDDRLLGRDGTDTLSGGGGDDFLHDGLGKDNLNGGSGADVFVICADTSTDTVADFENGTDKIDLSDWGRIYTSSVLTITSTSTGAQIAYGDNVLLINRAGGGSFSATDFSDADFLF